MLRIVVLLSLAFVLVVMIRRTLHDGSDEAQEDEPPRIRPRTAPPPAPLVCAQCGTAYDAQDSGGTCPICRV